MIVKHLRTNSTGICNIVIFPFRTALSAFIFRNNELKTSVEESSKTTVKRQKIKVKTKEKDRFDSEEVPEILLRFILFCAKNREMDARILSFLFIEYVLVFFLWQ